MFISCRSPVLSFGVFPLFALAVPAQDKTPDPSTAKPSLFDAQGKIVGAPVDGGGTGGKWGGRWNGRRRLRGKIAPVAEAIASGLEWLRRHQDRDGGWNATAFMRHDPRGKKSDGPGEGIGRVGISGFCLLPFLGDGSTLAAGPFRDVVRQGIEFLRTQQAASGAYSKSLLEHAVATYAICEAAGLSHSAVLGLEAGRALAYLASCQNADGGFSSRGKNQPTDAFTTVQAVLAYKSGVDFRLTDDRSTLTKVGRWLDASKHKMATTPAPIVHGGHGKESVLAAKLLVSFFVGRNPRKYPAMVDLANAIVVHHPTDELGVADPMFHYLATHGLYQMGGMYWHRWSIPIARMVVGSQRDDGNSAGSWDPKGPGAILGGRLYATALMVLTAESEYRYTRLVR